MVETAFDKRVNHKGWISNPTLPKFEEGAEGRVHRHDERH